MPHPQARRHHWVTGMHHIIFSLGFALQTMKLKLINQITWAKPGPPRTPSTPLSPT